MKNRIKELREKEGLTQKQLAKKAGLSNQSISFYEANRRKPKIETWKRLADFFGVSNAEAFYNEMQAKDNDLIIYK